MQVDFSCNSLIVVYFITGHGAFPAYLNKIEKRQNDKCLCGKRVDSCHYLFDSCQISRGHFVFLRNRTLEWNMRNTLLTWSNYRKLCNLFVSYTFWNFELFLGSVFWKKFSFSLRGVRTFSNFHGKLQITFWFRQYKVLNFYIYALWIQEYLFCFHL